MTSKAPISFDAASYVAAELARLAQCTVNQKHSDQIQEVANALYALTNDTDSIVLAE